MDILIALLALAALVAAILGLIKPGLVLPFFAPEKRSRIKAFGLYAAVFIVCALLMPSTTPKDESDTYLAQLKEEAIQAEQKTTQRPKVQVTKASKEQIAAARENVRGLLSQLIGFKGDTVFHQRGFGAGNPYAHKWLKAVKAASSQVTLKKGYPIELAASTGYLLQLGMEYMRTKGNENNSTRTFRQYVEEGLTPPAKPVEATTPTGPKKLLGKWKSTWGFSHTVEIVRQGEAATVKISYEDGSSGIEQYVAEDKSGQIKLTRVGDTFGEYYVINKRGELEYWSKTGNYYIAPKI